MLTPDNLDRIIRDVMPEALMKGILFGRITLGQDGPEIETFTLEEIFKKGPKDLD